MSADRRCECGHQAPGAGWYARHRLHAHGDTPAAAADFLAAWLARVYGSEPARERAPSP